MFTAGGNGGGRKQYAVFPGTAIVLQDGLGELLDALVDKEPGGD